jgi:predicted hydrolase (HD superfamily)
LQEQVPEVYGVDRKTALEALQLRIENKNLIKHSLAVEAIMRRLASFFHEDQELWGLAGLVHNIDIERVNGNMSQRGFMAADILEGLNFDGTIVYAVKSLNPDSHLSRRRKIDKALFCADPMATLILSSVLVLQEQKLDALSDTMVLKHFYEDGFARSARREQIMACSELDISLEEFIKLSLEALKAIKEDLGY